MIIYYVQLRNEDYEEDKLKDTEDFRAWSNLNSLEDKDDNDSI